MIPLGAVIEAGEQQQLPGGRAQLLVLLNQYPVSSPVGLIFCNYAVFLSRDILTIGF